MDEFISVIEELTALFQELTAIEENKLEAASKNRITCLEGCITQEQAAILKLRGLDKKREAAQLKAGWQNLTFQQILKEAAQEQAQVLTPLFGSLSRHLLLFQNASESARKVIELNLHQIDAVLRARQDLGTPYGPNGAVAATRQGQLTSRKI